MLHEETVNLSILVLKKRYFSGSLCKGQKACSAFKAISVWVKAIDLKNARHLCRDASRLHAIEPPVA